MKIKLAASVAAFALGLAASAHAAADLTVDYGSTGTPYSADGSFQLVEAGNPFGDAPRTVVNDTGGTLSGSGSAAAITTPEFSIDLTFTTTGKSLFQADLSSALPDEPLSLSLFDGATLLKSATAPGGGTGSLAATPIVLSAGTYVLNISGALDPSLEAEGGFDFSGTAAAVPEPATWAMMLIGFGGLGAALRGSRRLAAA